MRVFFALGLGVLCRRRLRIPNPKAVQLRNVCCNPNAAACAPTLAQLRSALHFRQRLLHVSPPLSELNIGRHRCSRPQQQRCRQGRFTSSAARPPPRTTSPQQPLPLLCHCVPVVMRARVLQRAAWTWRGWRFLFFAGPAALFRLSLQQMTDVHPTAIRSLDSRMVTTVKGGSAALAGSRTIPMCT